MVEVVEVAASSFESAWFEDVLPHASIRPPATTHDRHAIAPTVAYPTGSGELVAALGQVDVGFAERGGRTVVVDQLRIRDGTRAEPRVPKHVRVVLEVRDRFAHVRLLLFDAG